MAVHAPPTTSIATPAPVVATTTTTTTDQPPPLLDLKEGIDEPDDLEQRWAAAWKQLEGMLLQKQEGEKANMLVDYVSQSMDNHTETTLGLLYGMLVLPEQAQTVLDILQCKDD